MVSWFNSYSADILEILLNLSKDSFMFTQATQMGHVMSNKRKHENINFLQQRNDSNWIEEDETCRPCYYQEEDFQEMRLC